MARIRYPFGYFPRNRAFPNAANPLGAVSLATLMRWYWRVRTWKCVFTVDSAAASASDRYGSYLAQLNGATVSWICSGISGTGLPGGDETSLMGGNDGSSQAFSVEPGFPPEWYSHVGYDSAGYGSFLVTGGSNGYNDSVYVEPFGNPRIIFSLFDGPGVTYDQATNIYNPWCAVGAGIDVVSDTNSHTGGGGIIEFGLYAGCVREAYLLTQNFGQPGPAQPMLAKSTCMCDVTIDGIDVEAGILCDCYFTGRQPGTQTATVSGARINITPVDYWPYFGRDGHALYNYQTGDPAVNPTNGAPFTPGEIIAAPWP